MGGEDDEEGGQAEDEGEQDEGDDGRGLLDDGDDDEVEGEGDGGGEDEGADELDEDDELHAEAEGAAQVPHQHQLHEVVHRAVDPAPALRQQHRELLRHRRLAHRLRHEHLLALRERLQHQRRQVAVFAEQEQVLLVQRVDHVLRVVLHHVRVGEDGHPVVLPAFRRFDPVHAEAAGQTGDAAEDGFEGFGQVVRYEVSAIFRR